YGDRYGCSGLLKVKLCSNQRQGGLRSPVVATTSRPEAGQITVFLPSAVCCAMKATATGVQHALCLQLARCISSEKQSRTLVPTACTFSDINSRVSCPL